MTTQQDPQYPFVLALIDADKEAVDTSILPGITVLDFIPMSCIQYKACQSLTEEGSGCPNASDCLFVDIGSYNKFSHTKIPERVVQFPSGASWDAMQSNGFNLGKAKSYAIDATIQKEYKEKNTCAILRELQVTVEIDRMVAAGAIDENTAANLVKESKKEDWSPPSGYSIHHFCISPLSQNQLQPQPQPCFGLVYTMLPEASGQSDRDAVFELAGRISHAALIMSVRLFKNRIATLLWHEFCASVGSRNMKAQIAKRSDATSVVVQFNAAMIVRFLLAHHWFYPLEPTAHHLLTLICGGDVSEIYRKFGWPAPPALFEQQKFSDNFEKLRDRLVADFQQILKNTDAYFNFDEDAIRNLKKNISNAAIIIAGKVVRGIVSGNCFEIKGKLRKIDSQLSILPSRLSMKSEVHIRTKVDIIEIPIFNEFGISRQLKNDKKKITWDDLCKGVSPPGNGGASSSVDLPTDLQRSEQYVRSITGSTVTVRVDKLTQTSRTLDPFLECVAKARLRQFLGDPRSNNQGGS
jgi:hypothetical protein